MSGQPPDVYLLAEVLNYAQRALGRGTANYVAQTVALIWRAYEEEGVAQGREAALCLLYQAAQTRKAGAEVMANVWAGCAEAMFTAYSQEVTVRTEVEELDRL